MYTLSVEIEIHIPFNPRETKVLNPQWRRFVLMTSTSPLHGKLKIPSGKSMFDDLFMKETSSLVSPQNGCSYVYALSGNKVGIYVQTAHFVLNKSDDF